MDFWIYWIALGVIFIVMEMFLGTLDFLALGIAGLLTGLFVYILHLSPEGWKIAGIIFLVASIVALMITRLLIIPKIQGKFAIKPMSIDNVIGRQLTVLLVNKKLVVKYEGNYRNIFAHESLKEGDIVEVVKMKDNKLEVKLLLKDSL